MENTKELNMEPLIVYGILSLLTVIAFATLVIVYKIFIMHNVKNADGQYSWMVPNAWVEVQENLIRTQELMITSIGELTVHNKQISKLLETSTNVSLSMFEELKRMQNGKSIERKS